MNLESYKSVIDNCPLAYSYNQLVYNSQGKPVDFLFIKINKAFEVRINQKKKQVEGKRLSELFPDIFNLDFNWLEIISEIALNGGEDSFDIFLNPYNMWVNVTVFSNKRDYFSTFYKASSIKNLMSDMSREYSSSDFFYKTITENIINIAKAKVAILSLYNFQKRQFTIKAISGEKSAVEKIEKETGIELLGLSWSYKKDTTIDNSRKVILYKNVKEMLNKTDYLRFEDDLIKDLNLGEAVSFKILEGNYLVGTISIFMPKEIKFVFREQLDIFIKNIFLSIAYKNLEGMRKESESKYRSYIDNAPEGVLVLDSNLKIIEANKSVIKSFGFSGEELEGKSIKVLVSPEHLEELVKFFQMLNKDKIKKTELIFVTKSNRKEWFGVRSVQLKQKKYLCFLNNINLQKILLEKIQEFSHRLQFVIDAIPDLVCMFDLKGLCLNTNITSKDQFKKFSRISEGKNLNEVYDEKLTEKILSYFDESQNTGKIIYFEYSIGESKNKVDIEARIVPLDKNRVLMVLRNITMLKKMENSLRLASITALTSGISHEINQPLSAVKVATQSALLYEKHTDAKPEVEYLLNKLGFINHEIKKIEKIIVNMRKLTKNLQDNFDSSDVHYALKETLDTLESFIVSNNIKIFNEISKDLPLVRGNITQLEQIFTNILDNFIDVLRDNNSHEERLIHIRALQQNDYIEIFMENNGPQISQEIESGLFDTFCVTEKIDHMGLGLAIVQHILQNIDGSITLEKNLNTEVIFKISLKIYDEKPERL